MQNPLAPAENAYGCSLHGEACLLSSHTLPVSVNMTNVWAQLCYPIHPQTKSKSSWSLSSLWLRCDSSKRSIQSDRIYRPEIPKIYGGSPPFWTFYVLEYHHNMWMHWCICLKVCMGVGGCVRYILVHLKWYVHQCNYQLNNSSKINNQVIFNFLRIGTG